MRAGTSPNSFHGPFRGLDTDRPSESQMGMGWLTDGDNFVIRRGQILPRTGFATADSAIVASSRFTAAANIHFNGAADLALLGWHNIATGTLSLSTFRPSGTLLATTAVGASTAVNRPTFAPMGIRTVDINPVMPGTDVYTGQAVMVGTGATDTSPGGTGHDGGAAMVVVKSDGTMARLSPVMPRADYAPTCATGAGNQQGVFSYKTSWFRSSDNAESAPSDESAHVDASAGTLHIVVTRNATYPDVGNGIDTLAFPDIWRVYRKRTGAALVTEYDNAGAPVSVGDGVGADDDWYLVAEVAYGTLAYTDNTSDGQLGTERVRPNNLPPPASTQYVCAHRGRMFYAASGSDTVYYSELPDPARGFQYEYVGQYSFFQIPMREGDEITGLWSFGQSLIVFTHARPFRVGTDALESDYPTIEPLNGAAGCDSYWTIQELPETSTTPGFLIYANRNGAYMFDGQGTRCLTQNGEGGGVGATFDTLTKSISTLEYKSWYWSTAMLDPNTLEYHLTCALPTDSEQSKVLVYSVRDMAWSMWSFAATVMFRMGASDNWNAGYFARSASHIYRLGDTNTPQSTDAGSAFTWSVQFPRLWLGSDAHKIFWQFWTAWRGLAPATTLYLGIDHDSATSASHTSTARTSTQQTKLHTARYSVKMHGERMLARVAGTVNTAADYIALCGYGVDVGQEGVRP